LADKLESQLFAQLYLSQYRASKLYKFSKTIKIAKGCRDEERLQVCSEAGWLLVSWERNC